MQSILFGIIFMLLNLVLIGMAIVCVSVMYKTVWHVVGVIQRKEPMSFDWNTYMIMCCAFLLLMILVIWPIAMFSVINNTYL